MSVVKSDVRVGSKGFAGGPEPAWLLRVFGSTQLWSMLALKLFGSKAASAERSTLSPSWSVLLSKGFVKPGSEKGEFATSQDMAGEV